MTVPYICSTCCHRIVRRSIFSGKRQAVFASSHALENILPEESHISRPRQRQRYSNPQGKASGEASSSQWSPRRAQEEDPSRTSDDFTAYMTTATARPSGRYSRAQQPPVIEKPFAQHDDHPQGTPRSARSYATELEVLLKEGEVEQAWQFFSEHYTAKDCLPITKPSFQDAIKVRTRTVFTNLLDQITSAWRLQLQTASGKSSKLPSPAHVIKVYEELKLANAAMYRRALWSMSVALLDISTQQGVETVERQHDMEQLMDLWSLCLSKNGPNHAGFTRLARSTTTTSPWSFVNAEALDQRRRKQQEQSFDSMFATFVKFAQSDSHRFNTLAATALITHDLLTRSSSSETPYMEFAASMNLLIRHSAMDLSRTRPLGVRLKDSKVGDHAIEHLMKRLGEWFSQKLETEHDDVTVPLKAANFQPLINRLGRAVEQQNLDAVERLWNKAQGLLRPKDITLPDNYGEGMIKTYEQFLLAFFRLRRPQSALHVWNALIQSGLSPTVRTWTVMMKGCHISRDVYVMESMWQRMRASGVQPDAHAWTTRIDGLLGVGKIHEGLRALDEMGREWIMSTHNAQTQNRKTLQAATLDGTVGFVPKPDTATMNSALSALGGRGKKHIPNVLAWGRSFHIDPDITTYNSLLNVCLANGEQAEAMNLLKTMADTGIPPNSATYTILINSMFHSAILKGLSHSEQEQLVMTFILSLESNGVPIDGKGYTLLVDRLLKEYNNVPAVEKIMAHMESKGVKPSAHIYTILMTYYFDSNPPDLFAANQLWNQIEASNEYDNTPLDVIFFDRMMEGYARHGDVGRTEEFLTRMSVEGKRPGWLAMASVIKCLVDNNRWDRALTIVMDCYRQEGLLSVGLRGMKGQSEFWQLVSDLGMLDHLPIDVNRIPIA